MANRTHQKSERYGYKAEVNRSGKPGKINWERVGFLFGSSQEAKDYLDRKYPNVSNWSVEGVRLNVEPVVAYGDSNQTDTRGKR
jgi:hypothetical protein